MIDEVDKPEYGGARCGCMCFFDFAVDLPHTQDEIISIELFREITDDGSRTIIWQDKLNLSHIQGEILIESNIRWCD